jgi:hypothetical protein
VPCRAAGSTIVPCCTGSATANATFTAHFTCPKTELINVPRQTSHVEIGNWYRLNLLIAIRIYYIKMYQKKMLRNGFLTPKKCVVSAPRHPLPQATHDTFILTQNVGEIFLYQIS